MKSKFKKLMAAALVLCLMLALLPAGVLADGTYFCEADINSISAYYKNGYERIFVTPQKDYYSKDDEITITITPTEGYEVTKIKYQKCTTPATIVELNVVHNDDNTYSATFNMPDCNIYYSAEFALKGTNTYNVECSVKGNVGGTISAEPNTDVAENVTVQVTVTPEDNYQLKSLTMSKTDGSEPQPIVGSYTFEMPAYDVKLVAEFEQIPEPVPEKYTVNTAAPQNGTLSVDKTEAAAGETVNVTANAANGYVLDSLYYIDGNGGINNIPTGTMSFNMPASDVTVKAWFRPVSLTHDVNVSSSAGGTVSANPSTDVAKGTTVTLTVVPNEGYWLKSLKIDGVEFANRVDWSYFWYNKYGTVSFTMTDADVNVYAEFTNQLYVYTNYNGYRGEVEVLVKDDASGEWVDTNFADRGDWVAFKPVAYTGFNIGAVTVTGNWSGRSYDIETWYWHDGWYYFQMPWESVTINVDFTDNSHRVFVNDAANGSLVSSDKWAQENQRVYITATPDKGYSLAWLSVKGEDGTKIEVYEAVKANTYYFFMPKQAVTVSAVFALKVPSMPFTDVSAGSWYYNAVEFVYSKGIMQGVSANKFGPGSTITRGMVVTMLWRMAGSPTVSGGSFADVASGSYYATAVAWAAKNGIVDGYNSSKFGPNDAITREQFATILYRYAKWLGYSASGSSLAGYADGSSVSSWAKDAMSWAVKNSIVTGVTTTRLNPTGTATRAEAAQMLMNFYSYLN